MIISIFTKFATRFAEILGRSKYLEEVFEVIAGRDKIGDILQIRLY